MEQLLHSNILGQGKPLIILHGLFGLSDNWMTLGRKFAEHFEVHVLDLRNHGRSFHHAIMDYETMVEDVLYYCNHHKINSFNIIGHSMGGKVAMFLAVQHPEKIEHLIVADIAPKTYPNRHQFIFDALFKIDFKKIKTRNKVAKNLQQTIQNQGIVQFLLKNVYHRENDQLAWRFNVETLFKNYTLLNENLPVYSQFNGDTLFLKGEYSDYIIPSDESVIKAHFPKAIIKTIAKAGHWVHAENPEEFFRYCIQFFD